MKEQRDLYLYEELMLLALRDDRGTVAADDTAFLYTVAGAIVTDLLLSGHVKLERIRKNKIMLVLRRSTRTGDKLLDECVRRMKEAKRRASIETWVSRFAGIKKLKHRIAIQLCKRGILRADEDKVLLIFTRKIYPEIDPVPEREIIGRLRKAIFTRQREIDPRTTVLVTLADKANVLKNSFDKQELKAHKQRIKEIGEGNLVAKAAQDVIDGVMAAIIVASVVPTMAAVTVVST